MHQKDDKKNSATGIWILAIVSVAIMILSLSGGAAYTAVQKARLSAARANIGHIQTALQLAEMQAEQDGLGPPPQTYENLLKSYNDAKSTPLSPYEKYILAHLLDLFGSNRDFDFAVTRYQDATGAHIQVYYFPVAGRTDVKRDRHFIMTGGVITEKNG